MCIDGFGKTSKYERSRCGLCCEQGRADSQAPQLSTPGLSYLLIYGRYILLQAVIIPPRVAK